MRDKDANVSAVPIPRDMSDAILKRDCLAKTRSDRDMWRIDAYVILVQLQLLRLPSASDRCTLASSACIITDSKEIGYDVRPVTLFRFMPTRYTYTTDVRAFVRSFIPW